MVIEPLKTILIHVNKAIPSVAENDNKQGKFLTTSVKIGCNGKLISDYP